MAARGNQRKPSLEKEHHQNHPAGDDLEAQHRWDIAMGLREEEEAPGDSAAAKRAKMADSRIMKANGGFEDWVYQAGNLVTELIESLEEESFGLQEMLNAARESARSLTAEKWQQFQEVPRRCIHSLDKEVITTLFSAAEPQWRTLLTTPKKGGTCVFLHIGTQPPSLPIIELLTKLGWFGIVVSPVPPAQGNEDRIQHCELDPFNEEDEAAILKLQVAKGSLLPKPSNFMLAFADVVWDSDNIDGDTDQASVWKLIDENMDGSISRKEFRAAQKAGMISKDAKFKTFDINGDGTISKDEFVQSIKKGLLGQEEKSAQEQRRSKPAPPMNANGYGMLGVTWSPQVRWRLRMLRNIISVALQRLSNQGSLVITWHGLPHHPALLFITSQLRPVFLRVHVLVPEGTRSWETWILAASFKRQEAEEVASKGGSGFMFKNFIDNAYRCSDLDDCLLWTLPVAGLLEEYRLGGGERTIAKGYNELWTAYAQKFRDMSKEFGAPAPVAEAKKARAKKKPRASSPTNQDKEGKAKAKAKPKAKAAEEKPAAAEEKPAEEAEKTTLPPVSGASAKAKAPAKPGFGGVMPMGDPPKPADQTKPKPKRFISSRSLPDLCSTFGSAPGVKKGYPNEYHMAESWPIIRRALDHLEKKSDIVERIDRDDIAYAMKMTRTAKYQASEEGKRMGGLSITMPGGMD